MTIPQVDRVVDKWLEPVDDYSDKKLYEKDRKREIDMHIENVNYLSRSSLKGINMTGEHDVCITHAIPHFSTWGKESP